MNENTITPEQVEQINEVMEENKMLSEELKEVAEMPSNNGVEEHEPEEGKEVKALVSVDPVTGEHKVQKVLTEEDEEIDMFEEQDDQEFYDKLDKIESGEIRVDIDDSPANINEVLSIIKGNNALIKELTRGTKEFENVSEDGIRKLLEVANRKMKKENFNVFKELPSEIQTIINKYCSSGGVPINTPNGNQYRNMIAEQLVDEFISNIGYNRIQHDLSTDIDNLFKNMGSEIADKAVEAEEEREAKYREEAEKIEDPEKKEKVIAILDAIQEGYNLSELKEFAKKCKIKRYELERPDKIYADFVRKYKDSSQNVYGIDSAIAVLLRNLNKDNNGNPITTSNGEVVIYYDEKKVNAFFIAFAKQIMNYDPEHNILQHAYIYYVLYNAMFTDINIGEKRASSITYMNNVKEVINNLVERNKALFS